MEKLSVLGCGWLGKPLSEELIKNNFEVLGSTTSREKVNLLREAGIKPYVISFDPEMKGYTPEFFDSSILIIAVPPRLKTFGAHGYLEMVKQMIQASRGGNVSHIIFISSTSVYPDVNRSVVENDADPESVLAQAEALFLQEHKFTTTIIRFAGLVGPGRHPGRFLSGKEVEGGDVPVNIIHLEDCISIIKKIIDAKKWVLTINACADNHPSKREFYTAACRAAGLPLPVFRDGTGSGFKIVSSEKLKRELAYNFLYSDPMKMLD